MEFSLDVLMFLVFNVFFSSMSITQSVCVGDWISQKRREREREPKNSSTAHASIFYLNSIKNKRHAVTHPIFQKAQCFSILRFSHSRVFYDDSPPEQRVNKFKIVRRERMSPFITRCRFRYKRLCHVCEPIGKHDVHSTFSVRSTSRL